MSIHKQITVSGFVQGVSYRKKVAEVAKQLGVTGWVRNVSNGTVEASFEGRERAVETAIVWCAFGPNQAKVEEVSLVPVEDEGHYHEFRILEDRVLAGSHLAA